MVEEWMNSHENESVRQTGRQDLVKCLFMVSPTWIELMNNFATGPFKPIILDYLFKKVDKMFGQMLRDHGIIDFSPDVFFVVAVPPIPRETQNETKYRHHPRHYRRGYHGGFMGEYQT